MKAGAVNIIGRNLPTRECHARWLRASTVLAGVAVLAGCATFSSDGGSDAVKQTADGRLGKDLSWARTDAERDRIDTRVAELLILRPDMPRSLTACMNEVNRLVQEINGPRSNELVRRCGLLSGELRYGSIDGIFARGLHEYLSDFLERIYELGDLINTTYFWSVDE